MKDGYAVCHLESHIHIMLNDEDGDVGIELL
jgi:hypothetical protein